ncbi:hypothetical protein Q427_11875 [Halomonas sp. BC04]|nr:hypothetical protein Q427_11875 [Halomonas sp. BC04]
MQAQTVWGRDATQMGQHQFDRQASPIEAIKELCTIVEGWLPGGA